MTSLRTRLFAILIASTGVIWLSGFAWIYWNSRLEIEHLLDRRLMEAAHMVVSLAATPAAVTQGSLGGPEQETLPATASYEHRLSCQIWSFDGRLVGRSSNAPAARLTEEVSGFSEPVVDGHTYRVYAEEDPVKGVRVLVGDDLGQRLQVVNDLVRGLLIPAAVVLPLIALLIWVSIRRGLLPLRRVAEALSQRGAENLTPLDLGRAPSEIRPLVAALNALFEKVVKAREHERSFVAYAAHELRTPLAGLKTQTQIAASAVDARIRSAALAQTLVGVDRTSRLVRQLLAMSKLDASAVARQPEAWLDVDAALDEVCGLLGRELRPERVVVLPSVGSCQLDIDRELFDLAVRNLLENALQVTPPDGTVRISIGTTEHDASLCIEDDGPGLSEDERDLVLQRFYRGRHKAATGSGLGLPIVTAALNRAEATLRLAPSRTGPGLAAEIVLGRNRLRVIGSTCRDADRPARIGRSAR